MSDRTHASRVASVANDKLGIIDRISTRIYKPFQETIKRNPGDDIVVNIFGRPMKLSDVALPQLAMPGEEMMGMSEQLHTLQAQAVQAVKSLESVDAHTKAAIFGTETPVWTSQAASIKELQPMREFLESYKLFVQEYNRDMINNALPDEVSSLSFHAISGTALPMKKMTPTGEMISFGPDYVGDYRAVVEPVLKALRLDPDTDVLTDEMIETAIRRESVGIIYVNPEDVLDALPTRERVTTKAGKKVTVQEAPIFFKGGKWQFRDKVMQLASVNRDPTESIGSYLPMVIVADPTVRRKSLAFDIRGMGTTQVDFDTDQITAFLNSWATGNADIDDEVNRYLQREIRSTVEGPRAIGSKLSALTVYYGDRLEGMMDMVGRIEGRGRFGRQAATFWAGDFDTDLGTRFGGLVDQTMVVRGKEYEGITIRTLQEGKSDTIRKYLEDEELTYKDVDAWLGEMEDKFWDWYEINQPSTNQAMNRYVFRTAMRTNMSGGTVLPNAFGDVSDEATAAAARQYFKLLTTDPKSGVPSLKTQAVADIGVGALYNSIQASSAFIRNRARTWREMGEVGTAELMKGFVPDYERSIYAALYERGLTDLQREDVVNAVTMIGQLIEIIGIKALKKKGHELTAGQFKDFMNQSMLLNNTDSVETFQRQLEAAFKLKSGSLGEVELTDIWHAINALDKKTALPTKEVLFSFFNLPRDITSVVFNDFREAAKQVRDARKKGVAPEIEEITEPGSVQFQTMQKQFEEKGVGTKGAIRRESTKGPEGYRYDKWFSEFMHTENAGELASEYRFHTSINRLSDTDPKKMAELTRVLKLFKKSFNEAAEEAGSNYTFQLDTRSIISLLEDTTAMAALDPLSKGLMVDSSGREFRPGLIMVLDSKYGHRLISVAQYMSDRAAQGASPQQINMEVVDLLSGGTTSDPASQRGPLMKLAIVKRGAGGRYKSVKEILGAINHKESSDAMAAFIEEEIGDALGMWGLLPAKSAGRNPLTRANSFELAAHQPLTMAVARVLGRNLSHYIATPAESQSARARTRIWDTTLAKMNMWEDPTQGMSSTGFSRLLYEVFTPGHTEGLTSDEVSQLLDQRDRFGFIADVSDPDAFPIALKYAINMKKASYGGGAYGYADGVLGKVVPEINTHQLVEFATDKDRAIGNEMLESMLGIQDSIDKLLKRASAEEADNIRAVLSEHIKLVEYDDTIKQLVFDLNMFNRKVAIGGRQVTLGKAMGRTKYGWAKRLLESKRDKSGYKNLPSVLKGGDFQIRIGSRSLGPIEDTVSVGSLTGEAGYETILRYLSALTSKVGKKAWSIELHGFEASAKGAELAGIKGIDAPSGKFALSILSERSDFMEKHGVDVHMGYGDMKPNFIKAFSLSTLYRALEEMPDEYGIFYKGPEALLAAKRNNVSEINRKSVEIADMLKSIYDEVFDVTPDGDVVIKDPESIMTTMYDQYKRILTSKGRKVGLTFDEFIDTYMEGDYLMIDDASGSIERQFNVRSSTGRKSLREIINMRDAFNGLSAYARSIKWNTKETEFTTAMLEIVANSMDYLDSEALTSVMEPRFAKAKWVSAESVLNDAGDVDKELMRRLARQFEDDSVATVFGAKKDDVIKVMAALEREASVEAFGVFSEDVDPVRGTMAFGGGMRLAKREIEMQAANAGLDRSLVNKMDYDSLIAKSFEARNARAINWVSPVMPMHTFYDKMVDHGKLAYQVSRNYMKGKGALGWTLAVGALLAIHGINKARGQAHMKELDEQDDDKARQLYRLTREGYGYNGIGIGQRQLPSGKMSHRLNIPQISEIIIDEKDTIDKSELEDYMADHMNLGSDWVG